MPDKIKLFLRRQPFVLKVFLLIAFSGILVGFITDRYSHNVVDNIFEVYLNGLLEQQSQEDRLRLDHYLKNFHQVVKITAEHRPLLTYLENIDWSSPIFKDQVYKKQLPKWLLSNQALSHLATPRYVLLLDGQEQVREIYSRRTLTPLPKDFVEPSSLLIEKGRGQTHLYNTDQGPYAFTAEDVFIKGQKKATLILVSPVNNDFLMAAQKDMPYRLIGLIDSEKNTLITSNNKVLLPEGIHINELKDKFVITGREYHDYGGAEMVVRLSSFVDKKEIISMSRNFITTERKERLFTTIIYFLVFILISLWISRRIVLLKNKVDNFSEEALGSKNPKLQAGDQLDILEERFQILTEEVSSAQRVIKKQAQDEAKKQLEYETKSRQLNILELIMDSLGFGVLIKKENEYRAENKKMLRYLEKCPSLSDFVIPPHENINKLINDKDGNELIFQLTALELFDKQSVIVVNDITETITLAEEKEQLQEELHQAMKMESIGLLAGGIAHDFNNILTAILGYSQLGMLKTEKSDPLKSNFEYIFESAKRASDMTQQLLSFSRKQKIKPQIIDLKSILGSLKNMFSRLIGEHIKVEVFSDDNLWKTMADRTQIEQVLMNLALNARDAMKGGGQLVFKTSNVEIEKSSPRIHYGMDSGKYIHLTISDTGTGMTREDMEHIFEPFYTTKEIGQGTGLGLASVFGIVKQNKGQIYVQSKIGKGSTFEIYLPASEVGEGKSSQQVTLDDLAPGNETILLVEDEATVKKLITGVLTSLGYRILEAANAEEAEQVVAKNHDNIDLLFTDIIMPGINGVELASRVSKNNPATKILFMTGYKDNSLIRELNLGEKPNLLHKPLTPISIAQKVREVLDE